MRDEGPAGEQAVPTTLWSRVRQAQVDSAEGKAALTELLDAYWTPIYYYIRNKGHSDSEAEDITQEFCLQLVTGRVLDRVDETGGRFRNFLAMAINRFVIDEHRRRGAQKRGGHLEQLHFDFQSAEAGYVAALRDDLTPEAMLHIEWYERFRQRVVDRVRRDYEARDELYRFEDLFPYMREAVPNGTYTAIAERWGVKPNTVAFAMRTLKDRWQGAAIVEAGETCDDVNDAVEELQAMRAASQRPTRSEKHKPKPET